MCFRITEGRHPVIEQMLKGSLFVPNDTTLDETENRHAHHHRPQYGGQIYLHAPEWR